MKKLIWLCSFFIALAMACSAGKYGTAVTHGGKAKITLRVLETEDHPVEKAQITSAFFYDPEKQGVIKGETDTNGLCVVEGITSMDMSYFVEKDGYYRTDGRYLFGQAEPPVIDNRWQPWNPTNTVILKKIKNPIPMYVKEVKIIIPALNQPLGFDLEKGDWVSPYGVGVEKDFIFTFSREIRTSDDYEAMLRLDFANQGDGVQEITADPISWKWSLRLPHQAPSTGYQTNWVSRYGKRKETGYFGNIGPTETMNYFYRIRTVIAENGEIKEALYGKIHCAISVGGTLRDDPKILFTYYLNPTPNDRNVEFDPAKNLFGGRDRFAP
jgi:hypothetical protein